MAEKLEQLNVDLTIKQVSSDDVLKDMEENDQLGANQIIVTETNTEVPMIPVGSIFVSAIPQTDARVHLLDGSTISQTGVYETFANLIKALDASGQPITYKDDDQSTANDKFNNDVSKTGNCGKFIIDDKNGTIRLPKITTFIQGLSNITNIGSSLSAGLPNIEGTVGLSDGGSNQFLFAHKKMISGAFENNTTSGSMYFSSDSKISTSNNEWSSRVNFDASKSNSIYGNSTTVQPRATQYPYYIVLASGYKSSQVVDIDNIMNETNVLVKSYSMMPSSKRIANIFTNKAVGSYDYTVPANGWAMVNLQFTTSGTANNGAVILYTDNAVSSTHSCPVHGWNSVRVCIPVSKGDVAHLNISGSDLANIWGSFFIYAKGQEV